jgi:excisionase family DNA binding protein
VALYTVQELADFLGISLRTARELTRSGEIKVVHVGPRLLRVTQAAVAAYVAEHESA